MPTRPPVYRSPFQPEARTDQRPSAARRHYGRDHGRWRLCVLRNHPNCRRCELSGLISPATVAHHLHEVRDRPDLRLDVDNGVGVCAECHNAIHHGKRSEAERFRQQMEQKGYGVRQNITAGDRGIGSPGTSTT